MIIGVVTSIVIGMLTFGVSGADSAGPGVATRLVWGLVGSTSVEAVTSSADIIRARLRKAGFSRVEVRVDGGGITVLVPAGVDPAAIKNLVMARGGISFHWVHNNGEIMASTGGLPAGTEVVHQYRENPMTGKPDRIPFLISSTVLLSGKDVKKAKARLGGYDNRPYVRIRLTREGAGKMGKITADNIGRRLAVVMDGQLLVAPVIRDRIDGGLVVISGNFTLREANEMAAILSAGSLPAEVLLLEERPSPAQDEQ